MKILILLLLLALITIEFSCNNISKTNNDVEIDSSLIIKKDKPNSLLIKVKSKGKLISTGTGFIVIYKNIEYLITNWHIITGRETDMRYKTGILDTIILFTLAKDNPNDNFSHPTTLIVPSTKYQWIEYKDSNNILYDITALKFPNGSDIDVDKIEIDNLVTSNNIDDTCFIFGYPKSYLKIEDSKTIPKKIISKYIADTMIHNINKSYAKTDKVVTIEWNKSMENGISGSPVYSKDLTFEGIYGTKLARITIDGSDTTYFGFFWNIESIKKLIQYGKPINWSKIK
jgi:hypothetical protein